MNFENQTASLQLLLTLNSQLREHSLKLRMNHFAANAFAFAAGHAPTKLRTMKHALILCAALLSGIAANAAEDGWIQLFNGKDFEGWEQHGGKAKYAVQDGVVVGTTVLGTGNSFLCTKETYGDFILEFEFKVDPKLNSGVQIRSEVFDQPKTLQIDGKEVKVPADRVHGYQIEIDMDPKNNRWWTAGIYDEARRGWLYPGSHGGDKKEFTAQGAKVSKQEDWNRVRVEAKGSSIKTWLNGELRADIKDSMTLKGLIALQVHGVGNDKSKENITVMWRNLRLKRL